MTAPGVFWVATVYFLAWFWPEEATTWSSSFRIGRWFVYWSLTYWGTPVIWNPKPGWLWLGPIGLETRYGFQGANRWAHWHLSATKRRNRRL